MFINSGINLYKKQLTVFIVHQVWHVSDPASRNSDASKRRHVSE